MPLYTVIKPNRFHPVGTFLEQVEGGLQKVRTRQENGRLVLGGYTGLVLPFKMLRPFILRIQKRGLDSEQKQHRIIPS